MKGKFTLGSKVAMLLVILTTGFSIWDRVLAQTALTSGDVCLTGVNNLASPTARGYQFVILRDIEAGTVIKFANPSFTTSDATGGTTSNSRNGSTSISIWTASAAMSAGSVVTITQSGTATDGTISQFPSSCGCGTPSTQYMAQSTSGGQILVYYGGTSNSTSTDFSGNTTTSVFKGVPLMYYAHQGSQSGYTTWLTSGSAGNFQTYLPSNFTYNLFLADNTISATYTGPRTGGTIASYRAAILNPSNWTTVSSGSSVTFSSTDFALATTPAFTGSTSLTLCEDASATSINSNLAISDASTSATETWSITSSPSHGSLGGFPYSTTASGGSLTPSGLTYTPTSGYSGTDAFTVQVSNGTNTASTTINVTIAALPTAGTIASTQVTVCAASPLPHSISGGDAGGVWVSSNTAAGTINASTGLLVGINPGGTTTISYTVSSGGCSATATAVNTVYALTVPGTIGGPSTLCTGVATTYTTSSTTTSTPPYTHAWVSSNSSVATVNATTGQVTGISAGTFRLSYLATGCGTVSTNTTINVSSAPALGAIGGPSSVVEGSNITLTNSTSGGTWTSTNTGIATIGSSSGILNGVSPGSVTISYQVTNSCGTSTQTTNITVESALAATQSQTNVNCFGGSDGTASVVVTAGTPPYTYSWSPGGGSDSTVTGLSAGSYTCTITDGTSASIEKTFTITQPSSALSIASIDNDGPVCPGTTLSLSSTLSGGTPGYLYSWSGPNSFSSTVQNPSVSGVTSAAGGVYTLTATDANGCTASGTTSATIFTRPVMSSVSNSGPLCSGGTLSLSAIASGGSTPYTYSWGGPNTFSSTVQNPSISSVTTAATGTYTVVVSDANGCVASGVNTTSATINARPVISSISAGSAVCSGSSASLSCTVTGGSTPYVYTWSGPVGFSSSLQNPSTGSVTVAGTYTLNVTEANGCTASATTTTTVNSLPSVGSLGNNGPICAAATLNLFASGGGGTTPYSYSWSGPNSFSSTLQNPSIASATTDASGTYSLVLTDVNGCAAAGTHTTAATVNPRAAITALSNNGPVCATNTLSFTSTVSGGTAPYSYSWSGPGGFSSTLANPSISGATTAASGTYTLVVTDVAACAASGTHTTAATVHARPAMEGVDNTSPVCAGNTLNFSSAATGGSTPYSYSWSGPNAFSSSVQNPSITGATTAATGTYTVVITDVNGCLATGGITTTATVNPLPAIIGGNPNVCIGLTTALSDATGSGTWSSSSAATASVDGSGVVTGNILGTATISYTLGTGCYRTLEVSVNPFPAAITGVTTICLGNDITLSDATPGGTWSSGNTAVATVGLSTGVVTGHAAGTAYISYTSDRGCTVVSSAPVVNAVAEITGPGGTCTGLSFTLSSATTGGTWHSSNNAVASISSTTGLVTGLTGGTAMISYSKDGCYRTKNILITTEPPAIGGSLVVCPGETTTLSSALMGGTWQSSNAFTAGVGYHSGIVTGVAAGTVGITYSLSTSCRTSAVVTVNPQPVINTPDGTSVCVGFTRTYNSPSSGGTWSSSNTAVATVNSSGVITGVSAGSVRISYTLPTGCSLSILTNVYDLPVAITGASSVCLGSTTVLVDASGLGASWSSSDPSVASVGLTSGLVTGVAVGSATLTFTQTTGCYTTTAITVNPLPAAISGTLSVCRTYTQTLSNTDAGGTWTSGNYGIASVGSSSGIVTGNFAGTTWISYTLPTGCTTMSFVTVNELPAAITGTAALCTGGTTTLSNAATGGTWSSSDGTVATVGAGTGIVNGISTGTATISYTNAAGCYKTRTVTVGSLGPIGGTLLTCVGSSTTLTNATSGGAWSCSPSTVATISSGGVLTGTSAGTASVTYSSGGTCRAYATATVISTPSTITGTTTVNVATTTTLSSGTSGGVWSSSNTAVATIDGSGVVTGVAPGTVTITYAVGGCSATTTVTVNTPPPPISGASSFCLGSGGALPAPSGGGASWTSSNTSVATIGLTSGVVTTIAPGTTTITFTVLSGAFSTKVITVSALPSDITGTLLVCKGSTTTLSSATSGGTWTSSTTARATVGLTTGVVTGINVGNAIITYTDVSSGCYVTAVVTVAPLPNAGAITGPGAVPLGGSITLVPSASGGTWMSGDVARATVTPAAGSNATLTGVSLGTVWITYTVTNGCGNAFRRRQFTVVTPRPGVTEAVSSNMISLYPNPTSGTFTLVSDASGSFSVYTIDSRKVATYVIDAREQTLTLPDGLAAGVYMCRFEGENGTVSVVRLVYDPR